MFRALQRRNNPYDFDRLSLKRQTIREDGAQSHGPLRALVGTLANRFDSLKDSPRVRKAAGLPAPKEES
jgi:hypothetical protein